MVNERSSKLEPTYQRGDRVHLDSAQGPITRAVVADYGDVVLVCRDEELKAAMEQLREPHAVGFRKADIIGSPTQ